MRHRSTATLIQRDTDRGINDTSVKKHQSVQWSTSRTIWKSHELDLPPGGVQLAPILHVARELVHTRQATPIERHANLLTVGVAHAEPAEHLVAVGDALGLARVLATAALMT